jgi:hypothetical protein
MNFTCKSKGSLMAGQQRIVNPDLDEQCGRHFTYRDFVECSDTWWRPSQRSGVS